MPGAQEIGLGCNIRLCENNLSDLEHTLTSKISLCSERRVLEFPFRRFLRDMACLFEWPVG